VHVEALRAYLHLLNMHEYTCKRHPQVWHESQASVADDSSDLGSFEKAKAKFTAAAMDLFGAGWTWLVQKPDGNLTVTSTPNNVNIIAALHPTL
jgi:superoxide dismutase